MLKIVTLALRGFLLVFGAVVLALSVTLAKHQTIGSPPSETSFSSFCGAFGIVVTALGILAFFFDKIPFIIVLGADALASVFYLAGAIALTVALKPVSSCTSSDVTQRLLRYNNKLLNGGCWHNDGLVCPNAGSGSGNSYDSYTSGRCQMTQADYVFEYLGFLFGAAVIVVGFMYHRRNGGGSKVFV
ncbi:hypothetical protein F5X96DRAFT_633375 [Biscogniauxia mediterranea]|nr:hypothetical protein F5X96DRAFT_633375 [Biscogniauxia mediterranea]